MAERDGTKLVPTNERETMQTRTITVPDPVDSPKPEPKLGTLAYAIDRCKETGWDLIVERTDFPASMGQPRYYAIKRSEKRLWTPGEREITQDMIEAAWYAQDCPDMLEAI